MVKCRTFVRIKCLSYELVVNYPHSIVPITSFCKSYKTTKCVKKLIIVEVVLLALNDDTVDMCFMI